MTIHQPAAIDPEAASFAGATSETRREVLVEDLHAAYHADHESVLYRRALPPAAAAGRSWHYAEEVATSSKKEAASRALSCA